VTTPAIRGRERPAVEDAVRSGTVVIEAPGSADRASER
jgi:hypothetical protein